MGRSYKIKIKSTQHYRRCVDSLKEVGVQFCSNDEDELKMRRCKDYRRKAWLYIGSNKVAWVFGAYSVVKYAKTVKRKEAMELIGDAP